jgi:hypothetical protein
MAERLRDDTATGAAGRLIDLIAGKEFRGVRRIPRPLALRGAAAAGSRAAGNTTGGIS